MIPPMSNGLIAKILLNLLLLISPFVLRGQKINENSTTEIINLECSKFNIELAQNSNAYLELDFFDSHYFSSLDGVIISTGHQAKILNKRVGHLYDSNIQSDFYPDAFDRIWYCSFRGFYSYSPKIDSLSRFRFSNVIDEEIFSDYSIIQSNGDYLYIGAAGELFKYDVKTLQIRKRWILNIHNEKHYFIDNEKLYVGSAEGLKVYSLDNLKIEDGPIEKLLDKPIVAVSNNEVNYWVSDIEGNIYCLKNEKLAHWVKLSKRANSISCYGAGLIVNQGDQLTTIDRKRRSETYILRRKESNAIIDHILDAEIDKDSMLWISSDGVGIFNCALKRPFKNFIPVGKMSSLPNVTGITSFREDESYLVTSRNYGIVELDDARNILRIISERNNKPIDIRTMLPFEKGIIYIGDEKEVNYFNPEFSVPIVLTNVGEPFGYIFQFNQNANSKLLLVSTYANGIGKLTIDLAAKTVKFDQVIPPIASNKPYTYFNFLGKDSLVASFNEDEVHVFQITDIQNPILIKKLDIQGGVWDIFQPPNDSILFIGNTNGLFEINTDNWRIRDLADGVHLPNQVYCIYGDGLGKLWMSTNDGILSYNIEHEVIHNYSRKNGVLSSEFNSFSKFRDSSGNIYFGGTKGLTIFNPVEVQMSQNIATLNVLDLKINDIPNREHGEPNYINTLELPYKNNTLSFEFQAIDYADLKSARTKFRMSEYDDNWLESNGSIGFSRYPNMLPGHYTFSIMGANADGVWQDDIKTIDINIKPPIYMTWWFRLSSILIFLGISYSIVSAYFRRKIEKRDLLLKNQSLIIEKQAALKHERSRIAAEMHDDLGTGLTTIKYLSEKALRHKMDSKHSEIRRIADQSSELIANMSEIIWAMNSRFDKVDNLVGYIRRYTSELFEKHERSLTFHSDPRLEGLNISGEKRRNLFLCTKESINNFIKHSKNQNLELNFEYREQAIVISFIEKNVDRFNVEEAVEKGNGLYNIKQRIKDVDGSVDYSFIDQNMIIQFKVPITLKEGP